MSSPPSPWSTILGSTSGFTAGAALDTTGTSVLAPPLCSSAISSLPMINFRCRSSRSVPFPLTSIAPLDNTWLATGVIGTCMPRLPASADGDVNATALESTMSSASDPWPSSGHNCSPGASFVCLLAPRISRPNSSRVSRLCSSLARN